MTGKRTPRWLGPTLGSSGFTTWHPAPEAGAGGRPGPAEQAAAGPQRQPLGLSGLGCGGGAQPLGPGGAGFGGGQLPASPSLIATQPPGQASFSGDVDGHSGVPRAIDRGRLDWGSPREKGNKRSTWTRALDLPPLGHSCHLLRTRSPVPSPPAHAARSRCHCPCHRAAVWAASRAPPPRAQQGQAGQPSGDRALAPSRHCPARPGSGLMPQGLGPGTRPTHQPGHPLPATRPAPATPKGASGLGPGAASGGRRVGGLGAGVRAAVTGSGRALAAAAGGGL